jgi:uncharacterized protein YcnI
MPRHALTCPDMPDSPTAVQPDSARHDTSVVTAYLAPDRPDSARQLLDSCQECQPDRGPTGVRQDPTMLDSPDRPDSQGSTMGSTVLCSVLGLGRFGCGQP